MSAPARQGMWNIPEDTIVTYFLMRFGPELKAIKVVKLHDGSYMAGSQAHEFVERELKELLTPKYRAAINQVGCTNESWRVGFKNMKQVVLIAASKMWNN